MAELGELVRTARGDRSPVEVARRAEISPAYLNKLENDAVTNPSPHILYKLAKVLTISYSELMRAAGYVVPGDEASGPRRKTLAFSGDLTEDEIKELEQYLDWYRQRQKRGARK